MCIKFCVVLLINLEYLFKEWIWGPKRWLSS